MKSVVDKDYEELEIKDDWNKKYDFEMQTGMYEEIPKRSRYYQSLIDSDCLNKGVLYRNLPDSLICFICMKDPLGCGRMVIPFMMRHLTKTTTTSAISETRMTLTMQHGVNSSR